MQTNLFNEELLSSYSVSVEATGEATRHFPDDVVWLFAKLSAGQLKKSEIAKPAPARQAASEMVEGKARGSRHPLQCAKDLVLPRSCEV